MDFIMLCSVKSSCGHGFFFVSSRRRHTRLVSDWSSDVCSSDLPAPQVDTMVPKYLFWIQMTTVCRHVVFPVIVGLLCVTTSCRSSSNADAPGDTTQSAAEYEIGRASCRERV